MKRKKKKLTIAEIRINLILLGIICGISLLLFLGRSLSVRDVSAPVPVSPPMAVSVPLSAPVEKPLPSLSPVAPSSPAPPVIKTAVPVITKPVPVITKTSPVIKVAPVSKTPSVVKPSISPLSATSLPPEKPKPVKNRGSLVFVFDDAGHNLKQLEPFLKLPFPCTIAVLPGLQYSKEAAQRIRAAGKTVVLHQPMQAINLSIDPGPGAIRKGMTAEQIRTVVRKNLAEVGPVVGINNHEGSLITADRPSMTVLLDIVREEGIFFLDSRTNSETVAPSVAREKDMTIWERSVFLDNSQDRTLIIEAVNSGMKIADRKGAAVMIGHIWSNDLADILTKMYPELASQGFSLSTIAEIAIHGDMDE